MSSPLTFGVEFEFALATLREGFEDPDPTDPRDINCDKRQSYHPAFPRTNKTYINCREFGSDEYVNLAIQRKLREAGLRARGQMAGYTEPSGRNIMYDDSPTEANWYITRDASVHGATYDKRCPYKWYSMEINSPAFYIMPEAFNQVKIVCETLVRSFRIHINKSCGLHVHIGNGKKGFKLSTLHNLAALLWTFEPRISSLHPTGRQEHPTDRTKAFYCRSMRTIAPMTGGKEMQNVEAVSMIYAEESINGLCDAVDTPYHAPRYKFWNLINYDEEEGDPENFWNHDKKTIEFRQHAATLDAERVLTWVQTVAGFVQLARTVNPLIMAEFILEQARQEDENEEGTTQTTIIELLQLHGLPTDFYRAQLSSKDSRDWTRAREYAQNLFQLTLPNLAEDPISEDGEDYDPAEGWDAIEKSQALIDETHAILSAGTSKPKVVRFN